MLRGKVHSTISAAALVLASILGMLLGSGAALAHIDTSGGHAIQWGQGWYVDDVATAHSGTFYDGSNFSYREDHFVWGNAGQNQFKVADTRYYNGSASDNVWIGTLQIWDEYGNHSVGYGSLCRKINGIDYTWDHADWDYSGLDSTNNEVYATTRVWKGTSSSCTGNEVDAHDFHWIR